MLGAARDTFRVEYSRHENFNAAKESFQQHVQDGEFDGRYYQVMGDARELPDGRIQIKTNSHDGALEVGVMRFHLESGSADMEWFDKDPDE